MKVEVEVDAFREGRTWSSEERKERGGQVESSTAHGSTGEYGKHKRGKVMQRVSVSSGRTINLSGYNFGRIEIGLECEVDDGGSVESIYDAAAVVVDEVLEREVATMLGQSHEASRISMPDTATNIVVMVSYGLTISLPKMSSAKVDIGVSQPISNDADLNEAISEVQDSVTRLVAKRRDQILASANASA